MNIATAYNYIRTKSAISQKKFFTNTALKTLNLDRLFTQRACS